MDEQNFKKLIIDTIKVGDNPDKEKIVSLIELVTVRYEKTGEFTRNLWNHYKEYIYLCIVPQKLIELKSYQDYLYEICDSIYPPNDEYEFWGLAIRPGELPNEDGMNQIVLFEDIQRQIIEEIRKAKYVIWIAMAWFTDPILCDELLKKKKQGVTIEIILDDNSANRNSGINLDTKFLTHWVTIQSLYKNIMHNKFCVIDLQTVVHGTFNWTKAANYNKETIAIVSNRASAETFADEFMKIKQQIL